MIMSLPILSKVKLPKRKLASDESSEEGEEEAKAEVTKEFQELVGDEDTVKG